MTRARDPLVTVYIVNHNYGKYLGQAIESVLRQTFHDYELIIIDDGSTDDSHKVIERYDGHEKVVTILQHNHGLNATNNIALRAARGRYIIRLDADDYLDDHALQILSGMLERSPEVGLVFPDYYLVDEGGNVLDVVRRHNFEEVGLLDQPAHGACTMIRTGLLRELGGYDEEFRCQDGYDLWVRFIQHYKVRNVNLPLFYYRRHPRNLTRNEEGLLEARARILAKQRERVASPLTAVAIVPVRGRVTDPSSRALELLGGKPLVDWTIDTVLMCDRVSDVVLTTPDENVLKHVAETYADKVIAVKRDRSMARLNTELDETILGAIESFERTTERRRDVAVVLHIESPFRRPRHIDSAVDIMELFDTDSVISVRPDTDMLYRHNGGGLELIRSSQQLRLEAEELYREVGDLHVVRIPFLRQHRKTVGGKVGHIVMDERCGLSILSDWDWEVAELYASKLPGPRHGRRVAMGEKRR